jgi:hypothetical protein
MMGALGPVDWGNVPAWVSGLAGSGALVSAASVYISGVRRERKAQAQHISARLVQRAQSWFVVVDNYSELNIYAVGVSIERFPYGMVLLSPPLYRTPDFTHDDIPKMKAAWEGSPDKISVSPESGVAIVPNGTQEFELESIDFKNPFGYPWYRCEVHFKDALSQSWQLSVSMEGEYRGVGMPAHQF